MRYRITAPAADTEGRHAGIMFTNGVATVDTELHEQRRALQYFRQAGYIVEELDEAGNVVVRDAEGNPVDAADPESEEPVPQRPPLPADSAPRPDWEEAAVARGMTAERAAEFKNKPELIAAVRAIETPESGDLS